MIAGRIIRHPAAAPAAALLLALLARLAVVGLVPYNYSFDGYQRWAGREHLLVQDWLPATQSIVWAVSALGGGILGVRLALSLVGALAIAAGAVIARAIGGPAAGWLYAWMGLFPSFVAWSTVPYQEGTFLLLFFAGLALALAGGERWKLAADLAVGALALVRYEGWPLVALYVAWRRTPRALVALWGAGLWLALKLGVGVSGYAASPVNFADWEGLAGRATPARIADSLAKLARQAWQTGAWVVLALGLAGSIRLWRRPGVPLLSLALLTQLAAVTGWMLGLETAINRMQVILCALAAIPAAALLAPAAARLAGSGRGRAALAAAGLVVGGLWAWDGVDQARDSVGANRWEIALLEEMDRCPECEWVIEPRRGLGTRDRHDGCEILQGISERLHGRGFWCATWPGPPPPAGAARARWERGGYAIEPGPGR